MRKNVWLYLSVLGVFSVASDRVLANDDVAGFFCARLEASGQNEFVAFVNANGRSDGNGALNFQNDIRRGDMCLHNATILGSFGVVMGTGEVCSSNEAAFTRSVGSLPGFKEATPGLNALAAFELANGTRNPGSLVFYRGEPSFQPPAGVSASQKMSYTCVRQEGGTQ